MAQPPIDDEAEDKPLDPAVEKVRRKLMRFVGVNLGILFVALMAVVVALVYKDRGAAPPPAAEAGPAVPGEPVSGEIVLPAGAEIVSQSISGNRVSVDARLAGGGRAIFVYDLAERRVVGRIDIRGQ